MDESHSAPVHHQAVGGAVGMACKLPEASELWRGRIRIKHVMEARKSLRDIVNEMSKALQILENGLSDSRYEVLFGFSKEGTLKFYCNDGETPLSS